ATNSCLRLLELCNDELNELSAYHLASLAVRQVVDEHDVLGNLVDGEPLAAVRLHVIGRHLRAGHDRHAHTLPHLGVGNAGCRDVDDAWMLAQDGLDLDRPELLAATVDRVGESTARVDVALSVLP